jgi:signal recognition particle receptor subunit beta
MSRHRDVRNLTEDDYYDDYDDYDDEDYYNEEDNVAQQQYAPPFQHKPIVSQSQPLPKTTTTTTTFNQTRAVTGHTAATTDTTAFRVTKPPPGWEKPTQTPSSPEAAGVSKPPPGWGKPTPVPLSSAGISKPPSGWGKPTAAAAVTTPTKGSKGVMQPPTGWGKPPSETATTLGSKAAPPGSISPKPSSNNNKGYTPKPLPDVLKQNVKSQLSMVVLGHVDAGKSTLMGQLLVQVGQISKRDANKQGSQLSWLLDENESERQRGVTMEIGTKGFSVAKHDIVILDAPGHADFIPIMITGAANADVALLVVAAVRGEFEAGFTGGGQTKEHVLLARGLGVTQVLVAINKLDVEGWSQERYNEIQSQIKEYLLQQEFKPKRIRFVPLSGLTGENVKQRNDPKLNAWYKGPTLLEAINTFQPANRQVGTYRHIFLRRNRNETKTK